MVLVLAGDSDGDPEDVGEVVLEGVTTILVVGDIDAGGDVGGEVLCLRAGR